MERLLNMHSISKPAAGIIIILLFWWSSWALDPDKRLDEYLVDHWNTSEGFPSELVHSITQTPDGYLWIATEKGLCRYDGITFSPVSFAGEEEAASGKTALAEALYLDNNGTLWIGSNIGLTAYDYQTRRFKTFTTAHGITGGEIRCLLKDIKGNLWIGFVSNFLDRLTNGQFTAYNDSHGLKGHRVNSIIESQTGNLLIGTRENGIFQYRDGKFTPYPTPNISGFLINMCEGSSGPLWISTSDGLLRKTGKTVEIYSTEHGLSSAYTTDILEDSQRTLWVGSTKGLNRLKKELGGSIHFEHILESHVIVCLFEDREGCLWVGTYGSGLFRLKNARFKSFAPLEAYPANFLFSIHRDSRDAQGLTWLGTTDGKLFRLRENHPPQYIKIPGISGVGISAIITDAKGNPWVGTNGKGVFQKKNNTFSQYTKQDGMADNFVAIIFLDSRGNLWFGTDNGASVFHTDDNTIQTLDSRNGLSGKKVYTISEDNTKRIWIGTDKGTTVLSSGKIDAENMTHYLVGIPVTWIYEDPAPPDGEGRIIWIATYGAGLKRVKLKDGTVTTYKAAQGMTSNFLFRFFEDKQGNFWFMSDSGVLRVAKSGLNRLARQETDRIDFIFFDKGDGIISPEFHNPFSRHSAFRTQNGELWFLSQKYISIVNPETIRINKFPPPVVIEKAFFNREFIPLPLGANNETFEDISDVRFRFTATTLLSAEKVTFKYRLEGFEEKWNFLDPGRERAAYYENLESGTYTFRVTACNAEGVWNTTGASVTFTLEPLFHQTFLFKIVVLLLAAAFAAAAVYIYKKRPFDRKPIPKDSPLDQRPDFVAEHIRKLMYLLEVEKVYRRPNTSLRKLAKKLSIHSYLLSQILNEKLKCSFSHLINSYRIEEAKHILTAPKEKDKKITTLAHEVGFNSVTAFYKAFKKFTGKTPTQYRNSGG